MTSYARLKPFYVSMSCRNNAKTDYSASTSADTTINATCKTQFNAAIVERASDFIIAIERVEISTNGIPFYDSTDTSVSHQIIVHSISNPVLVSQTATITENAYSLSHLLDILNKMPLTNPNTMAPFYAVFILTSDGFIKMTLPIGLTFNDIVIELPQTLNNILGISLQKQLPGLSTVRSTYPRFDMGDEFDHMIFRTDLPTYSDALGNAKLQVLTDLGIATQYSSSLAVNVDGTFSDSGMVCNTRQKLVYTPSERRYLELVGDFPINNITVDAFYQNNNGELKRVPIPMGGSFEVKIGFYLRQ